MDSTDYTVKAGDLGVNVLIDLSYSTGVPPDLTPLGTTARFRLRPFRGATLLDLSTTIVNATTVSVTLDIPATPGLYEGEVLVQWAAGNTRRFPADPEHPYLNFNVQAAIPAV